MNKNFTQKSVELTTKKQIKNMKIITEISFLKMCLMQNKKEEKDIDKIETKNNSKDNEIPIIIEEKQNEEKEKNKSIKINNVFCGPSKELKNNFVKNY